MVIQFSNEILPAPCLGKCPGEPDILDSSAEEVAPDNQEMTSALSQPQLVRDVQWRLEVLPHCTPLPNLLLNSSNGLL